MTSTLVLNKSWEHNNQKLEIFVVYSPSTNTVTEINSIWLHTMGLGFEAGDILFKLFESEINKMIDETDWRYVYRDLYHETAA